MRRTMSLWRAIVTIFTIAAIVHAYRTRQTHGRYYNVPFEFRIPTIERAKKRMWNPDDRSLFTPNIFGVGWTLNFHEAARRLVAVLLMGKLSRQRRVGPAEYRPDTGQSGKSFA